MKVYVDDNDDYRITYSSRDGSECLESMGMQPIIVESLSDYTKQVRKEVISELINVLNESQYMNRHNSIDKETLFKVLDQIEKGETNVKN